MLRSENRICFEGSTYTATSLNIRQQLNSFGQMFTADANPHYPQSDLNQCGVVFRMYFLNLSFKTKQPVQKF